MFKTYKWSTGAASPSIAVNQPGFYSLPATYRCSQDTVRDTLFVDFVSFPIPSLVSDTIICSREPVILNAELAGAMYRRQDESTNPKYYVTIPGYYWVEVFLLNCTKKFNIHISDCEILTMPNVFTPNNDHTNDLFAPMDIRGIVSATLSVYNRWGEKVFTTNDLLKGWDGTNQKNKFSGGV